MRTALVVLAALIAPTSVARADRYEAALALELHGGLARVGETGSAAQTVPAFGIAARGTYATRNALAYDVTLGATLTQPATFADAERVINQRVEVGDVTRRTTTARVQAGAEFRLGPRIIPTVRLGLGPQLRYRSGSDLGVLVDAVPSEVSLDLCATAALGVELRLGRHRVIGVALALDHGQPLGDAAAHDVVALTVRISHYSYPRWSAPAW